MKILLTGKQGQLGFELQRSLAVLGEVIATSSAECNLADQAALSTQLEALAPDVIVNAAAYTAVDAAETNVAHAFAVNASALEVIGSYAKAHDALVIHYSTDYVFDGAKSAAYVEADPTDPLSVYGQSKRAGELALVASGAAHVTMRTSWVVGSHGNNFAKTMLRLAKERDALRVVADQLGVPTPAWLLADVTAHVIRQRQAALFQPGIFHVVPSGETNWCDYARFVLAFAAQAGVVLRAGPDQVTAITSADYPTAARRPQNSRLDASKFQATFGLHLPSWQSCLSHTLRQLVIV